MKDLTVLAIDIKNEVIETLQDMLFDFGYDDWWDDIRSDHQCKIENKIIDVIKSVLQKDRIYETTSTQ